MKGKVLVFENHLPRTILFSLTLPKKRRQRLDFLHFMPFHFFQRKNYTKYVAEYKATPQ